MLIKLVFLVDWKEARSGRGYANKDLVTAYQRTILPVSFW